MAAKKIPDNLSQRQVAHLLALHESSVSRYVRDGILPAVPGDGRGHRIQLDALDGLLSRAIFRRGGVR